MEFYRIQKKNYTIPHVWSFIAGMMLLVHFTHGQSIAVRKTDSLRSFVKFTILWHNGFEYERRISKTSAVDFFAGVGIGAQSDDLISNKARTIFAPDIFAEYRNYYNVFRRVTKLKKVANNSANFFFGRVETILPIKEQNYFNLLFSQGWGAQRSFCKRLLVGFHLGIVEHLYFDKPPKGGFNYLKFEPLAQVALSYVFQ